MEPIKRTPLKDNTGKVVGYCDNFRLDENLNTLCDMHIIAQEYFLMRKIPTMELWIGTSPNPSPIIKRETFNLLKAIRVDVESQEAQPHIVVDKPT